ncbi:MAG TPA: radical SAM protein [Nitrososphaera sp.]|nr:radical SAM protein [Nitrososphaera sp.]
MELSYDFPLYRPPSEAESMIFQVTLGCSFNKCSFCNMYRTKDYMERPWDEIRAEIDLAAKYYPETRRIFLADGDALNLSRERMIQILSYLREKFHNLERISCYAMPKNLLQKTDDDLKDLRSAGLSMLYVGIESGNDVILRKVTKGATFSTIVQACTKARRHGFVLSCMVILGLGGKTYTKDHISDTARVLTETSPDYVGALTLYLEDPVHDEFMTKFGEPFAPLDDSDILAELETLVTNFDPKTPVTFRANHASNVYSLGGTLPEDRELILEKIRNLKSHPEMLKPKFLRRF